MVHFIEIFVDGGCRGNGTDWAYGAAAAVLPQRRSNPIVRSKKLYWDDKKPTNQRAEITAIILGLELALHQYNRTRQGTQVAVTIYSDSRYAVDCMNIWMGEWLRNGWRTRTGGIVANQDLLERAVRLDDILTDVAPVTYQWIPREENELADRHCNEVLDEMYQILQRNH